MNAKFANILNDDAFKIVICGPGKEQLLIKIIELLVPDKHIKTLVRRDKENHGLSVSDKIVNFDMFCTSSTLSSGASGMEGTSRTGAGRQWRGSRFR